MYFFIHPFIQEILIKCVRCGRACSGNWGTPVDTTDETPAFTGASKRARHGNKRDREAQALGESAKCYREKSSRAGEDGTYRSVPGGFEPERAGQGG